MSDVTILFTLLFTKHFIVDFPLQNKFQWSNKGTYGHPGGLLHASLHGLTTMLCFWWYAPLACIYLGLIDMFIHYHIDWIKQQLNRGYTTADRQFWFWLGADQAAHYLTYVGIIYVITS